MATRSENEQRFKQEFEHFLISAMKDDPTLTPQQAASKAQENLMENNPFMPLKNGVCIINSLPVELLAHIFRVGVEMQREGGDDDDDLEPVEDKEEKKGIKKEINRMRSADEDEGNTSDEEEEEDGMEGVEALPTDDNDPEWVDEESEGEDLADDEGGSDDDEDTDSDAGGDDEDNDYDVPFEFLVSHVCRHWRETAINTPDLWSSIYIDQPHQWDRYEAYLERSKGQVLDLDINLETHSRLVLDLIIPKAEQWRSLVVEYDFWLHAREFLKQMAEVPSAPNLERLHMESYEDSTDIEIFEPLQYKDPFYLPFHGNAPNLRFVKLMSVHIDWEGAIPMFQGLQELDLRFHTEDVLPSWKAFSSYLKNSPQLIQLGLHESGPKLPDPSALSLPPMTPAAGLPTAYYTAAPSFEEKEPEDPYEWPTYPLEVPSLRELKLSHHEAPYATALLTKLHFPNLRTLSMDYEEGGDFTGVIEACSQPLRGVNSRRSLFQTIEEFKLKNMGTVRSSAISGMFEALSGLKHLSLTCFNVGDEDGGLSPPDTMWATLSKNAKTVLDALKAKRTNQNQSVPVTPISASASYPASASPSATSSSSADPVAPLTIVPPSPSAPLPPTGAGIEPTATPLTAQEELDSLSVKLLLPNLEGLRTAGLTGPRLRRFLLRRVKIGVPLKNLSVHHIDELSEADERWMEDHLETFEYYSDSEEDGIPDTDDDDFPPPFEDDDDPSDDDDDNGDEDEDEWEDTDGDDGQDGDDDHNDDDDDDDDAGDDGEGGGRVQTRRGPSARATRRGAASMHVTTGLATLD
ncbi:hypothetical protein FA13DRAFT_1724077 [Coprinellus micaceus]|uniref:F-box domain-containing protein n=1 Tax=Coprinellus micaceus TaxID=71717 RepID=A0A4Y7U0A6_COPMI|nr:hypothetical protein FA13DRAFT_1724077 [Coprinellus micaceus]